MKNKEIWKDIPGYKKYQITLSGNIRNKRTLRCLSKCKQKSGYIVVNLFMTENKSKTQYVHRLVLLAFLGPSKLDCNHKNGIKHDNRLENLEYCTRSENIKHSYRELGRISYFKGKKGREHIKSKQIYQYTICGKFIKEYGSMLEAERQTGIINQGISKCCNGIYKQSGGFIWKFI